jgi:hypothetical protein
MKIPLVEISLHYVLFDYYTQEMQGKGEEVILFVLLCY